MEVLRSLARPFADYLARYVGAYRGEWERFTQPAPQGAGYPPLEVSPYLQAGEMDCYVAPDGVAIASYAWEPPELWFIAGGPALMVDSEPSSVPHEIEGLRTEARAQAADQGGMIGIYRIVGQLDTPTLRGVLPEPITSESATAGGDLIIRVHEYAIDWKTLVARLTFGAFGPILDPHLPNPESDFWNPSITRDLGFMSADPTYRRFFHYLELSPHVEPAAWDPRAIWARVHVDLRRDFAHAFAAPSQGGGYLDVAATDPRVVLTEQFSDRLAALWRAIVAFDELLETESQGDERIFQDFLERNTILLDVYGAIEARPRFHYPPGESPLGKTYVEPDFLVKYPGQQYRLIEIERPRKQLGTKKGQSSADVTQAAFQIAEWKVYIANHYDLLRQRYPGIATACRTSIIISRATQRQLGGERDVRRMTELYSAQLGADEILVYDDLLARARDAYDRLSAHAITSLTSS
jgi:Domain of unknown function (DUF4263)